MKQFYFTLLLLLSFLFTYSQENNKKVPSYRPTLNELKMTSYAKDSTANALVLYEKGNSYVDQRDYNLKTQVKHKIKIFNKQGFNKSNITISLYNNKINIERVEDITASTYNLVDGEVIVTNLDNKDIYREEYDENHTLVKFSLPNIKEGSVITYSYNLSSPFMFKYKGWNFQDNIPKLYSEYCASMPSNWEYNIKLIGGKKLFINEFKERKKCLKGSNGITANCFETKYVMKDIPAFIEEDYMTSKSNYLARVEYELKNYRSFSGIKKDYTKTWESVDKEIKTDGDLGRQLMKSVNLAEHLNLDKINETEKLKKAKAIYNYVQENYTWDGNYKIFKNVSINNLIKNKIGNVSSINILLHNLLKEANINVKPVLLSTRNNGFATKIHPVISDFNYLIIQATINEKKYLLDATDKYLNFGDIPFKCLNHYGRLLDFVNGSKWIDIKPNKKTSILYSVNLNLDSNNNFTGNVKTKRTGYHALKSKKKYFSNKDIYIETLSNKLPFLEIFNYETSTNNITSSDFSESYKIEYNPEKIEDILYVNPFFINFFSENPFKLQERNYPIDFGYKDFYLYMFKLNFDSSYSIIDKPKDLILSLPNNEGVFTFSTKLIDNSVSITMKIDFKESIYPPEYYPYLKEFMSKIVETQTNTFITLKKI